MELLFAHMNQHSRVSRESYDHFKTICSERTYKKDEFLVEEGEQSDNVFLILEGVAREYITTKSGEEKNKSLATKGHVVSSVKSSFYKTKSKIAIQALTDLSVIQAPFEDILFMCIMHQDLAHYKYRSLQFSYTELEDRTIDFLCLTAKERFIKFKERYPFMEFEIDKKHIASYLGTTVEELNEIQNSILKTQD
ncbi:Crp/Fnr family transcriptional regulator [Flavobacteriaceae bacterium]|nr:Crp/Fnr family transcriptional regulator [Flavobacteriaceae bacterium]